MGDDVGERINAAGEHRTVERLAELAAVADEGQWMVLRRVGRQRRPETLPLLAPFLTAEDELVRRAAVLAVMTADPSQAAPLIRPLLADDSARVAKGAAAALGVIASPDDTDALVAVAGHESSDVRDSVAEALGATTDLRALPTLEALLADDALFVRRSARAALRRRGVTGADRILERAPHRTPLARWRDARAARRSGRRIADEHPPVVRVRIFLHTVAVLELSCAAAIALIPIQLGVANPWATGISLSVATLATVLIYGLMAAEEPDLMARQHDRARALRFPLPDHARHVGVPSVVVRWVVGGLLLRGGALHVAVPIGLEVIAPTGGAISGAVAGFLAGLCVCVIFALRRLGPDASRTYVQITPSGRMGPRVWRAPIGGR